MFMQVSSNSFGQRIPQLAKALQHPPNDYQRSDASQRIDVPRKLITAHWYGTTFWDFAPHMWVNVPIYRKMLKFK